MSLKFLSSALMSFKRSSPAHILATMAFASWFCSLALTSFFLFSGDSIHGHTVFYSGWLSPLIPNFAWFANIFFIYGLLKLLSGKTPFVSAFFAILLSLDTFRLDVMPLNEGGSSSLIYGYGWGVVFWLLSFCLLLSAVGARRRESDQLIELFGIRGLLQPGGIILAFVMLGTVTYFSIEDRMLANHYEAQRLSGITFKRGKVCAAPDPVVTHSIESLAGPVEIIVENDPSQTVYPFAQVKMLLEWGIPIVRVDDIDYSYAQNGLVSSVAATVAPAAVLRVTRSQEGSINVTLMEASTNRTVFNQNWVRENQARTESKYYCPDYHNFPKSIEQPRKMIVQALNLPVVSKDERDNSRYHQVDGTVIGESEGGSTRDMKIARWKEMHPDKNISSMPSLQNTNCPADIGWDSTDNRSYRSDLRRPFLIKDRSYYLHYRGNYNAICDTGFVYIYYGKKSDSGNKYHLIIEKRNLQDFQKIWAINVALPDLKSVTRDDLLKIASIKNLENALVMELVNDDTGAILFIEVAKNGFSN